MPTLLNWTHNMEQKYPWKNIRHLLFDITLFTLMLALIARSYFISLDVPSSLAFQKAGTLVIVIALVIEYRDQIFYKNHVHQSIISGGLNADYLKTIAKLRCVIGHSALYFIIIGTLMSGFGDLLFKP